MMRLNYLEDAFPGIYHVVKTQQKSNFSGTSSKFAKNKYRPVVYKGEFSDRNFHEVTKPSSELFGTLLGFAF